MSLLFWGLFVLLTLITHSQSDPGINHVVSEIVPIRNSGGMFGAYVSGLLVDLFGFAAFVWPLVFLAWGAGCVSTWFTMPWWRWFGFFILGACFISFGAAMNFGVGDVRGGGMLGTSLYTWGRLNLSPAGAGLAWLFMLFISLELAFSVSWLALIDKGWGLAKEKAEANDISLARIGGAIEETIKRYAPHRKPEEPIISLLEINTDAVDEVSAPLSYADVSGAELAARQAVQDAARRAVEDAARRAAEDAAKRAVEDVAKRAVEDAAKSAAEYDTRHAQDAAMQAAHDAALRAAEDAARSVLAQSVVFGAPPASPEQIERLQTQAQNSEKAVPLTEATPSATQPADDIPIGYLGQVKSVDLNAPRTQMPTGKQPEGGFLDSLKGGIVGGVLGLFRSGSAKPSPLPPPATAEPIISLHSVLPDPEPELQPVLAVPAVPTVPTVQPVPVVPAVPVIPIIPILPVSAPVTRKPDPFALLQPPAEPASPIPAEALPEPHVDAQPVAFTPPWAEEAPRALKLPPLSLLQTSVASDRVPDMDIMVEKGEQLLACLGNFGIRTELVRITPGPVVTMFEIRPAPGTKVSRILNLNQDLALALKALAVRIHPIPGEDTLGVEIPNEQRATVNFRKILESQAYQKSESILTLALGADIGGSPVVADLARMPHLLVGGATGAGKSVCVNTLLLSLLCKATPDQLKLLMVDPKVVELAMYADLPHLIHPVVTEAQLAKNALEWAVHEMEQRYKMLSRAVVRNIDGYNQKIAAGNLPPGLTDLEPMPYLVIVVDELSDLMLSAGKDVETAIVRLAQLARACGIHLVIATQRPSVDVVTGLIKANFPSRIAFQVTSAHDSRTILDTIGAELLLGKGDMLFKPSGSKPRRLHGPFVSDEDVQAVVDFWKAQRAPAYALDFSEWGAPTGEASKAGGDMSGISEEDALYGEIVQFALEEGKKLSISKLQRRFRIGFNKAARFMERMEQDGVIQPAGHANRSREIL